MAKLEVLDWNNKKVEEIEVSDAVFAAPVRKDVLHEVVKWQLAKRRQGTHKAKTRGQVSGGGKKPFKQKGTGNARQGSNTSPLMPGGGVVFGPAPRDYSYVLPRKFKRLALRSALSYLNAEGKIKVVSNLESTGKTKDLCQKLTSVGVEKTVLVDAERDEFVTRASNNLAKVCYLPVEGVNVYDLLKFDQLILTKASIEKLQERCGVN